MLYLSLLVFTCRMITRRNVQLPPWFGQWLALGFKPVLSYSRPLTFSTFIGEDNEKKKNTLTL